jgi:hypothetical protein
MNTAVVLGGIIPSLGMADPQHHHAITLDSLVVRNESLLAAEVGSDLVMLHVEKNAYYDTDAVGAEIWRRLNAPVRVSELCAALLERYDIDRSTCEADVLTFLREAHREDVIRIA